MNKETVSVAIVTANYNNGPYITDFMESILESSVLPEELIFVDDGSSDDSLEKLAGYRKYDWLKVLALPRNVGFGNALNEGIKHAGSNFILRIDPDDRLHKDRIALQYELLSKNSEYGIVGSNAYYFNSKNGSVICRTNFPLSFPEIKKRYLKGEHGMLHGTVMGRSELFKKHLYIQENVPAEDYDIFVRMLSSGAQFINLESTLTGVRIHVSSASNNIKLETIVKTFKARDKVFNTNTSRLQILRYYYHILFYRKYLFYQNQFQKILCLSLSVVLYPEKAIRRIF